jgi:L-iditol 2-dehydrogenase
VVETLQTRMKAAVLHGIRDLRIEERDVPRPKPDEVLVRMKVVGVCLSDVHYFTHGRIGRYVVEKPLILGHECSGEVVEIGSEVKSLAKGDRVIVEPGVPCRKCYYCKRGRYNLCSSMVFMATPPFDGAFAEYVTSPEDFAYKMPENMTYEEGALIEPLSVGMYSVKRADIKAGQTVAVLGAGTIGLMTLMAARVEGAAEIFATDIVDFKLKFAKNVGATEVINSRTSNPVKRILELTEGEGVDTVIDAVGLPDTVQQAIRMVRNGGVVVLTGLGYPTPEVPVSVTEIIFKELDLRGVQRYANVWREGIKLVSAGRIDVKKLITHKFAFDKIGEAFEKTEKGTDSVKVQVIMP